VDAEDENQLVAENQLVVQEPRREVLVERDLAEGKYTKLYIYPLSDIGKIKYV
jgi:hypothetical protein